MAVLPNATKRLAPFLLVNITVLIASAGLADELSEGKYRRLLKELEPSKSALWRRVPWKTSLLEAQREAAKDAKPIFIWAMDGHPLGCT